MKKNQITFGNERFVETIGLFLNGLCQGSIQVGNGLVFYGPPSPANQGTAFFYVHKVWMSVTVEVEDPSSGWVDDVRCFHLGLVSVGRRVAVDESAARWQKRWSSSALRCAEQAVWPSDWSIRSRSSRPRNTNRYETAPNDRTVGDLATQYIREFDCDGATLGLAAWMGLAVSLTQERGTRTPIGDPAWLIWMIR